MRRPQFSIAGLLLFVLAAAIAFAALARPSCFAASAMFSLLLLCLTVALIGVIYRRGYRRAFWAGFLTCGSLYTVLSLAPWFEYHVGSRLVTTAILDIIYPKIPPLYHPVEPDAEPWEGWTGPPPDWREAHPRHGFTTSSSEEFFGRRATFLVKTTDEFLLIGHSLFAILAATGGGVLAVRFASPPVDPVRDQNEPSPRDP